MEGCAKVKNPCKICLLAVTNKNGLQCQGACRKWTHFTCLNYTPGKIQDIKAGIITITCPCPDCLSEEPKEFLTNPPYTCTNNQCPANKQPICEEDDCPTKRKAAVQPVSSDSFPGALEEFTPPSSAGMPTNPRAPPCGFPTTACGPKPPYPTPQPPRTPIEPPFIIPKTPYTTPKPIIPRLPVAPYGPTPPYSKNKLPKVCPMKPPPCPKLTPCPSKDGNKALRPQPCSCRSMKPHSRMRIFKTSSDVNVAPTNSVYVTMQEMCNTVGQLSTQLKQLMCKMMDTVPNI